MHYEFVQEKPPFWRFFYAIKRNLVFIGLCRYFVLSSFKNWNVIKKGEGIRPNEALATLDTHKVKKVLHSTESTSDG